MLIDLVLDNMAVMVQLVVVDSTIIYLVTITAVVVIVSLKSITLLGSGYRWRLMMAVDQGEHRKQIPIK